MCFEKISKSPLPIKPTVSFKITSATSVNEASPLGLSYLGLLPCSCQCWSGPKAPKISTLSNQLRANAAPYVVNNTSTTSGSVRPCIQCKLKMDQDQQQLQMHQQQIANQLNCSHQHHNHHPQQLSNHCHCSTSQNVNVPPIMTFPVPPPPIPPTLPTFLPSAPQGTASTAMTSNNQMYFVPFNMPSLVTGGSTASISSNRMSSSTITTCPHHSHLPHSTNKTFPNRPLNNNPIRNVPLLRTTATAAIPARRDSVNNTDVNSNENNDNSITLEEDDEGEEGGDDERSNNDNIKSSSSPHFWIPFLSSSIIF
ncbi:uncharacterized protein ACRADG_012667 [Cochliomyia hominivorax]